MDDEDHNHEQRPAGEGTETTSETLLIEEETDANGADHLGEPEDEVVEGTGTDVEDGTVVVIEFWKLAVSTEFSRHSEGTYAMCRTSYW